MRETAKVKLGGMHAPGSPASVLPAVSEVQRRKLAAWGPERRLPREESEQPGWSGVLPWNRWAQGQEQGTSAHTVVL